MRLSLLALVLLLALGGCSFLICGPGAGDTGARDMLHGMCSEF